MKKYLMLMAAASLMAACGEEKAERPLHSVMTVKPERVSETTLKNFSGVVKENAETSLGFRTGGTIEQVLVKEGDHVKKGQLLARLDAKDYQIDVSSLEIQYRQLKDEVGRLRQLYEGKSLSGNDYEKAVSGLEQVGLQLQRSKNTLSYTRLYAPCDGYVQHVNFERSEMVGAGTAVVTLLDVRRMEVEISIPQSVYQQRARFGDIYCTAGGQRHALHLISIVPKADNNQLYTAKLALDEHLTAGLSVDVMINVAGGETGGNTTLPVKAVFEQDGKTYVWVVAKDSTVSRREVSVAGTDERGRAVVNAGLQGDETVVRAGVDALQDKEKVKIISEASKTNVGGLI